MQALEMVYQVEKSAQNGYMNALTEERKVQ